MARAKKRMKEVVAQAKQGSAISWPRILATALAAVTMTLISTRLGSVFGALMLTAIISIGSALVAEFYRMVITITTEGTKNVIVPVLWEHGDDSDSGDSDSASETTPKDDEAEDADEAEEAPAKFKPERSKHYVSNQLLMLSLLFGFVSVVTIGISYGVARAQGGDVYQTTVENHPVQQLTEEQEQALVNLASDASKAGMPDFSTLSTQLTSLHSQFTTLQQQNDSLQQEVKQLSDTQSANQQEIDQLKTEIQALQTQLESLSGSEAQPEQQGTTPNDAG